MTETTCQSHVAVIDDSQEIVDLLRDILEEEGYQVSAPRERPDVDRLAALAPDVIVLDVLLEEGRETGWKFLEEVRLHQRLRGVPLVLCTASVTPVKDPEMAERLAHLGIRVILKPFDIDELLGALSDVLAVSRQPQGSEPR